MKKIIAMMLVAAALSACEPGARQLDFPVVPVELQDCKFHHVSNGVRDVVVVRCPNSTTSTTYKQGKATRTTVTVD